VIAFHPAMLHGGAPTTPAHPERRTLTLRFFGPDASYRRRPGPAGPMLDGLHTSLRDGEPFRHDGFMKLQ
jgi:hypothetical protein